MSTYEHHADIERARQIQQGDHEGRASDAQYEAAKHTVTYKHPQVFGLGRRHQWVCACDESGELTNDFETARRDGNAHVKSAAADVVAEVSGE